MQARKQGNTQGIDVSHWQGPIDWHKVAATGISFAFIKATQNSIDKRFLENVKGAKAAGLLVGAYHYIDDSVTNVDQAKAAAQVFYTAIQAAGGIKVLDLPPVMDYESNKSNLNKVVITLVAKTFLEEIYRLTGVKPMVYTYPSFISNFSGLNHYPLWIARYSATQIPVDASGWSRWTFWQYSDGSAGGLLPNGTRKVDGINGPVDLNEFDGTLEELKQRFMSQSSGKDDYTVAGNLQRDINVVSTWATNDWIEAKANGYLDGKRPGAPITREETAIVVNKLRRNLLQLISGNSAQIDQLYQRLLEIEKGDQ
ncbi:glycoside hydrolase [Paenibacillus anaericanus]|uniref:Glycoside hydrolase n=1 Tax=Paenibacillus anaericanus TaxID=170367 RepID=A0A433Y9F0_9BACL|nr:glycoside hydrolase family 25 protein [Paenibacillus anaericanus]RUT46447.1 glycoside hydrolase [Paenibacillus anaericanus]